MIPDSVRAALEQHLSATILLESISPVGGGCIHHSCRFRTIQGAYFLKYNQSSEAENFVSEAQGLQLLANAGSLGIPQVYQTGCEGAYSWILMEFVESGLQDASFWQNLGHGLAEQHRVTAPRFGLAQANFIGRLPQVNDWLDSWGEFWISRRLQPMERLARNRGLLSSGHSQQLDRLYERVGDLLPATVPSLLHGDLWSGNILAGLGGRAYVVDPAVYFGDREVELAFTRLFGGFPEIFYDAYTQNWPLRDGWEARVDFYNLYPLLVHLNLFGKGYLAEVESILDSYQ
jgi:fructosamine-3-kinase